MKKQLFKIWHSLGCLSIQLYLLIQSTKEAEESFREFNEWINKLKKENKVKIK